MRWVRMILSLLRRKETGVEGILYATFTPVTEPVTRKGTWLVLESGESLSTEHDAEMIGVAGSGSFRSWEPQGAEVWLLKSE